MTPAEDALLLLQIVDRHLVAMRVNLDPAFPDEEWGFLAQQALEKLLKAAIVQHDERPPFTHELRPLAAMAGWTLADELQELQTYAVEARYQPGPFPLPASRGDLLALLEGIRRELQQRIDCGE